jgi:hypothetical protein
VRSIVTRRVRGVAWCALVALAACFGDGAPDDTPWQIAGLGVGMRRSELEAVVLRDYEQSIKCRMPVPAPPACLDLQSRLWFDGTILELHAQADTGGRIMYLVLSGARDAQPFQKLAWRTISRWRAQSPATGAADSVWRSSDRQWEARAHFDDQANVTAVELIDNVRMKALASLVARSGKGPLR